MTGGAFECEWRAQDRTERAPWTGKRFQLLHFSSCLVGLDREHALNNQSYPVSGHTTSVDWSASALLEFTYLDLIMNRGMDPAAAKLPALINYAGDSVAPESPYPAAGFRFFPAR